MIKKDCYAAEMIPIRLIISIVLIAAIVLLIGIGYKNLAVTIAEHQVEHECLSLESTLYTMVASGVARDVDDVKAAEGTKRIHTFFLPENLQYLAFGVDPDPHNNGNLQTGLTEEGSMLCYRVEGGSKQVVWLSSDQFHFREGEYADNTWIIHGEGEGFIITNGGKTTLTFELVQHNSKQFILVHNADSFEKNVS